MNKETSARINMLRIILICGIVLIHIPFSIEILTQQSFVFQYVQKLGERTFFRAAVPTLSVISGYLLFASLAKKHFFHVLRGKINSLLIPLILWNLPLAIAVYVLQKFSLAGHDFRLNLYPFTPLSFLDAIFSVADSPVNFPLAFIRDIFVCVLIAPILAFVLRRHPWLGLVALVLINVFDVKTYIVLRENILLAFYFGGMAATMKWDMTALDRFRWWFMSLFLAACLAVALVATQHIGTTDPSPVGILVNFLRLLGPPAFWGLSAVLYRSKLGPALASASRYSFFIFCTHGPILVALWLFWCRLTGANNAALYPVFYIMAPLATLVLALAAYHMLQRYAPDLLPLLSGQRAVAERTQRDSLQQSVPSAAKHP